MKSLLATFALALSLSGVSPMSAEPVVKHQLSDSDQSAIDGLANGLFSELKAGNADTAVKKFLGTSGLMEGKKVQIAQLSSQIKTVLDIYGKISQCSLVETNGRGNVVQEQQYICQHERLATRWKLLFIETSNGWIAGNLYFDENVMSSD